MSSHLSVCSSVSFYYFWCFYTINFAYLEVKYLKTHTNSKCVFNDKVCGLALKRASIYQIPLWLCLLLDLDAGKAGFQAEGGSFPNLTCVSD